MVDAKFQVRGPRELTENIVIVSVDDKSIEELGRWPWKRSLIADELKKIAQGNPKTIAFDMVFSEPDPTAQAQIFQDLKKSYTRSNENNGFYKILEQEAKKADTDRHFSSVIQKINPNSPIVLGYFFYFNKNQFQDLKSDWEAQFQHIFDSRITAKISTVRTPPEEIPTGLGAKSSIEAYAKATPHHAFFDIAADVDGVIRKSHLIGKYKDTLFPSFGLKTVALATGMDIVVQFDQFGINHIFLGEDIIPTTDKGEFWMNYAGPGHTFPYVSFYDLYKNKIDLKKTFENKIVLVGVSAKAVGDLLVSPLDSAHPGTEINATIIENILHQNYLLRPSHAIFYELLFILIVGIILGILFQFVGALVSASITLVLLFAYLFGDYHFLFLKGILANSFFPALHLLSIFITANVYKYFVEEKKSRDIREAFQHYVAPAVVNEILKKPDQLKLGGEKRRLTVLFSDIRGFTTISESVGDPEKLTRLLNIYLSKMTQIIFDKGGMLDKYVGDEVMAVYGAPLMTQDHALKACQTAIEMIEALLDIRKIWKQEGVSNLNIGIGIHTGEMIVGNMGSDRIFDYTVIGDNVNLGSRLEGSTKQYGTHIIISEDVQKEIGGNLLCRELDFIRVQGKTKPIRIFELLVFAPKEYQDLFDFFAKGLSLYRQKNWKEAASMFKILTQRFPLDAPSLIFLERCEVYQENPPPQDWDGVFTMTTK